MAAFRIWCRVAEDITRQDRWVDIRAQAPEHPQKACAALAAREPDLQPPQNGFRGVILTPYTSEKLLEVFPLCPQHQGAARPPHAPSWTDSAVTGPRGSLPDRSTADGKCDASPS